MSKVDVWHITETKTSPVHLPDRSSLDAVTSQLPEGYYSTFRTHEGCTRVLGLTSHLQRLFNPVATPGVDDATLRRELREVLKRYPPGEARVRAIMTKEGQVYLVLEPLQPLLREVYEQGVRVETTELHREHPRLKSTTFISRSDAERKHIAEQRIFEALLVKDGKILEGMTSNFFYIPRREHTLCTAGDDILPGVTRQTVIEIARRRGLELRYEPLKQNQLELAREAFITSSSRGIVPVIQIDHVTVGEGRPGPVTNELMNTYQEYVLTNSEEI